MVMAGFQHEAYLYCGTDEFVASALGFLDAPVAAGQPALVMVDRTKADELRAALGDRAAAVEFVDMAVVGQNPARIIPAWRAFADANGGAGALWGIGEPAWPGRTPAELDECRHHEMLVNLVFADLPAFHLLCPYDTARLGSDAIEVAHATHPIVSPVAVGGPCAASGSTARTGFAGVDALGLLAEPLPAPPTTAAAATAGLTDLAALRRHIRKLAADAGLDVGDADDFVLAVDEVATNGMRYGGGTCDVLTWVDAGVVVTEVRDAGRVTDPLVGRRQPSPVQPGGRGLWIANQLCDLVQLRSSAAGTVVRLHKIPSAPRTG